MKLADSLASKKAKLQTLNKGASFLVQPHNLSFNKHAIKVTEQNHQRVIGDLHNILNKHEIAEARKLKGLSEEMAAQKKRKKPVPILKTEALLSKINTNFAGQQINGRLVPQPDSGLYKRMRKSQSPQGLGSFAGTATNKNSKPMPLEEDQQYDAQQATSIILRKSGSIGGNRSLFVNSRAVLMNAANSPLAGSNSSGSFAAMQDPAATLDYKMLKKGSYFSRTLAKRLSATHMESALSI